MPFRQSGGCPGCGNRFEILRTSNYSYRRCPKCRGVWITWEVLSSLLEECLPGQSWSLEGTHNERLHPCPSCRESMKRSHIFRIPIDYCENRDHGIWLDKDELQQILERVGDQEPAPPAPPTSFTSLLNDFFSG